MDINKTAQLEKRLEDVEVNDRRMGSQIQMVLDEQKKLLHSYYELDSKFKDVAKENKLLRNDCNDLRRHVQVSQVGPVVGHRYSKLANQADDNIDDEVL